MADSSVDKVLVNMSEVRNDIAKILSDFAVSFITDNKPANLVYALEELINNVLQAQKEQMTFDNKFLVGAYLDANGAARITLNHYDCDSDLTDNYVDVSLDVAIEKACEHLKECNEKELDKDRELPGMWERSDIE